MTGASVQYALLFVCWISALVTLVVFLESWFALTRRSRLEARRSNGTRGVVSVLLPLRGEEGGNRRTLNSILEQSYPFMELLLIYNEEDGRHVSLAREFCSMRSHVPVRQAPVRFSLERETERIRALDHRQGSVRGSWLLVLDTDVVLNKFAVESALEFAAAEAITAIALSPGIECRSFLQKLIAPSLEWFSRMIRVVDKGREKSTRMSLTEPFLLLHGDTHAVINRINRLPGILNESGWTLWSYRAEGLKTFEGDGSGWVSREASVRSLMSSLDTDSMSFGRVVAFVVGSSVISIVSVVGILFGIFGDQTGFSSLGILYFSAFSYSLMATSYFCYSRRLGAAAWFAPFWFLSHSMALILTLYELGRSTQVVPRVVVTSDDKSQVPTEKN